MSGPRVTNNVIRRAKLLRSQGRLWREIADELGFRYHSTIREACMRDRKYDDDTFTRGINSTRLQAERLMDEIPHDTRDLTARVCGDPLPGRSALDKMRAEA